MDYGETEPTIFDTLRSVVTNSNYHDSW